MVVFVNSWKNRFYVAMAVESKGLLEKFAKRRIKVVQDRREVFLAALDERQQDKAIAAIQSVIQGMGSEERMLSLSARNILLTNLAGGIIVTAVACATQKQVPEFKAGLWAGPVLIAAGTLLMFARNILKGKKMIEESNKMLVWDKQ